MLFRMRHVYGYIHTLQATCTHAHDMSAALKKLHVAATCLNLRDTWKHFFSIFGTRITRIPKKQLKSNFGWGSKLSIVKYP